MANDNPNPHDIRKRLLSNGYLPLPLDGKRCYIPQWSTVEIDEAFLERYRRSAKLSNTGIRGGNVLGVDIDADDAEHAEALERLATLCLGATLFCRFGKGHRRLLLYWIDEPIRKRRTQRYGDLQVEILSRGSQFVAYGIHPATNEPYEWPDDNPYEHDIDMLPTVTVEQIETYLDVAERYLADTGIEVTGSGSASLGEGTHDYRLVDGDVFDITEPPHGLCTVAEIKRAIGTETWVCNLTAIRPDSDSEAGRMSLTEQGTLRVSDFVDGVTYFEAVDFDAATGQLLGDLLPEPPDDTVFIPDGVQILDDILEHYCYVEADDTVRRLDSPALGIKRANFSQGHRAYVRVPTHTRPVLVTSAWLEHPLARKASHLALRPDKPDERIVIEDGYRFLNSYLPPTHPAGGSSEVFADFMAHLVPGKVERELVLDWIATKLQHPEYRMHALVMVAPGTFGTGRGTLSEILSAMIGHQFHTETTLAHLTGSTTQSQYNDYLSGALLVSIPEARDITQDATKTNWYVRRRAYEAIKSVVETSARRMLIVRKGVANISLDVYASLFIATNHRDALAIEDNDRRLLVVSNGETLPSEAAERVRTWLRNPANVGAAYRELMLRAPRYDPFGLPPMTNAKRYMLAASQSGIDEAWALWLDEAEGDVCTAAQWRTFAVRAQARYDLEFPEFSLDRVLDNVLQGRAWRVRPDTPMWQLSMKRAKVRPWIIRNPERWEGNTEHDEIRAEILRNGDPGGTLLDFPTKDD